MRTSVIITVDTEASVAAGILRYTEGFRPVIDQRVACNVNGRSEGLGFLIRTLTARGLRATFFVEAAHANYFGPAAMGRYVDQLLAARQDVQLHVHPGWFSFHNGVPDPRQLIDDACSTHTAAVLEEIFARCITTFRAWTGYQPLALRTGNFATGRNVYLAMSRLGIPLSSNLCVGLREPAEPELRRPAGCCIIEGIREYPATCFLDARGAGTTRFRPLQVVACSSLELITLLNRAHALGYDQVVIVTHPFEYVKPQTRNDRNAYTYARLVINRTVQHRFRRLCDYLAKHDDRFAVCTFAELASRHPPADHPVQPLRGSAPLSWLRTLENVLSDRVRWL